MNFLEIVRKANTFSGMQGDIDSVQYATGLQKTLVEFVNAAYLDIQLLRDNWSWMQRYTSTFQWGSASTSQINTGVNKYYGVYNSAGDLLTFIPYLEWITTRSVDMARTAIPAYYTIVPETNALIISPVLDTVTISYVAVIDPETLTTNTQIPKIPERYHYALVYKAAMDMGYFLGNAEVGNGNAARYDMILSQLLRNQNAAVTIRQRPLV